MFLRLLSSVSSESSVFKILWNYSYKILFNFLSNLEIKMEKLKIKK